MNENGSDIDRKIEIARLFMRTDRPLPKRGCSWAFFIFLGLLTLGLVIMYVFYKSNMNTLVS